MSRWFRTYGFQEVYDDLVIGAVPTDYDDVAALQFMGIDSVVNLVSDDEYELGEHDLVADAYDAAAIEERRLSLVDYGHLPAQALDAAVALINPWLDEGRTIYLHCRAGWQRSAAVAAAVVATREQLDVDQAVRLIRSRKPSADPLPHQREDLRTWWQARQHAGA